MIEELLMYHTTRTPRTPLFGKHARGSSLPAHVQPHVDESAAMGTNTLRCRQRTHGDTKSPGLAPRQSTEAASAGARAP